MDSPYQLRHINSHTDHTNSINLSWPEQSSQCSDLRSAPLSSETDSPRSYYTARGSPLTTRTDSPRLSYTANESPSPYNPTNSTSTMCSNMSFPCTVTSINSYKSHKNVFYPRRVHPPLPVTVSLELEHVSISPDVRFYLLSLFMNTDTPALHVGRDLTSPVPL